MNDTDALIMVSRDALQEGDTESAIRIATELTKDYDTCLTALCEALTKRANEKHPTVPSKYVADKPGKRFQRIWRCYEGPLGHVDRSAWAFVELTSGFVYKPANYKAPATNYPRGSIFDEQSRWALSVQIYGIGGMSAYIQLG